MRFTNLQQNAMGNINFELISRDPNEKALQGRNEIKLLQSKISTQEILFKKAVFWFLKKRSGGTKVISGTTIQLNLLTDEYHPLKRQSLGLFVSFRVTSFVLFLVDT